MFRVVCDFSSGRNLGCGFLKEKNYIVRSRTGNTFHNSCESEGVKVSENVGFGRNAIPGRKSFFLCLFWVCVFCFVVCFIYLFFFF